MGERFVGGVDGLLWSPQAASRVMRPRVVVNQGGAVHFLRSWWLQPFDYQWAVHHHRVRGTLTTNRVCIGVWSCFYGVAALLCVGTDIGPRGGPLIIGAVMVFAASSVIVGIAWIRGPWPTQRSGQLFVIYSDLGLAVVLLSFADLFVAMAGCALFAVTGAHVTAFHSPRWLLAHLLFATTITVVMYAAVLATSTTDTRVATARLLVLLPVLLSAPILLQSGLLNLRSDALDAYRDHLTGLRNRRGLEADFELLGRAQAGVVVAVLLVDVDNFKTINDRYGHRAGDGVLQLLATRLQTSAASGRDRCPGWRRGVRGRSRATDRSYCRPGHRARRRSTRADRPLPDHRQRGRRSRYTQGSERRPTPVSVAMLHQLLEAADTAMYQSKHRGGNASTVTHITLDC